MNVHKQRHEILKKFYHQRHKLEKTEMQLNVFFKTRNNLHSFRVEG